MSTCITVYLKPKKAEVLLKFNDFPYENVKESYGCKLFEFYSFIHPCDALPNTGEDPMPLTKELLAIAMASYDDEIAELKKRILHTREKIDLAEARIIKSNVELYEKIDQDISDYKESVEEFEADTEELTVITKLLGFAENIINNEENAKDYELIYTKG